jgi:hypothetical protein
MSIPPWETWLKPRTVLGMTSTADHLAVLTDWAHHYPSARFVVVAIADDESDAAPLGWGIALPDLAFTCLPEIKVTGQFRRAQELIDLLAMPLDVRIIWVDPEPEYWPPEDDER